MAVWVPCICGDEIVTVTPGSTLSELSTTLPLIEPVVAPTVWPSAATGSRRATTKTPRMYFITRLLNGRTAPCPLAGDYGPRDQRVKRGLTQLSAQPGHRSQCLHTETAGADADGSLDLECDRLARNEIGRASCRERV